MSWLRERLGDDVIVAQHMEVEGPEIWAYGEDREGGATAARVMPGDQVYGVLPVHLIEAVLRAGAEYYALVLPNLPPEKRGQELSASEMEALGARIFRVWAIDMEEVVE